MEKNKNNLVTLGIAAVVAIAAIGIFARSRNVGMFGDRMMDESSSMMQYVVRADVDSADYKSYSGLKGEDYDRQFLSNMITHHEGAVEMANLALKNAKHQEIRFS